MGGDLHLIRLELSTAGERRDSGAMVILLAALWDRSSSTFYR